MPVFVQGPLDGRAVETFLRAHRRDIDACAIDPPAADIDRVRVMLRVSIGGDGRVADVQPLQPRPESQQYRECVTNALRAWTFPRSDASASTVLIALEFTPEAL